MSGLSPLASNIIGKTSIDIKVNDLVTLTLALKLKIAFLDSVAAGGIHVEFLDFIKYLA